MELKRELTSVINGPIVRTDDYKELLASLDEGVYLRSQGEGRPTDKLDVKVSRGEYFCQF